MIVIIGTRGAVIIYQGGTPHVLSEKKEIPSIFASSIADTNFNLLYNHLAATEEV
ncbi:MAG: hypothetical protein ACJAUP_003601 [Cellvibrionaceae bacterium]|jgi:hypothetical protein